MKKILGIALLILMLALPVTGYCTVPDLPNTASFTGSASPGPFFFNMPFFSKSEIVVTTTDLSGNLTTLHQNIDYTVNALTKNSVGESLGGNVVLTNPLTTGFILTITRTLPLSQSTQLPNQGPFLATTIEAGFDYLTMITQQLQANISKTVGPQGPRGPEGPSGGVGYSIDALASYGQTYTDATIMAACAAVGLDWRTIVLAPGVWVQSADENYTAVCPNAIFDIPNGAVISYGAYALNIPNPVAGAYQWLFGTGLVTFSGNITEGYPQWFGAKGDGVVLRGASCTMSSTINPTYLTCAGTSFAAGDVGKTIVVVGAGTTLVGTAAGNLSTTIASYQSPTLVYLTSPALTTVTNAPVIYGTDNKTAMRQAAVSIRNLYVPDGNYLVNSICSGNYLTAGGIKIPSHTTIFGSPHNAILTVIPNGAGSTTASGYNLFFTDLGVDDVTIKGLKWQGDREFHDYTVGAVLKTSGALAKSSWYVIASQSTLDFTAHGASSNTSGTGFLCTSAGTLGSGDSVYLEATHEEGHGIMSNASTHVTVTDNIIDGFTGDGIIAEYNVTAGVMSFSQYWGITYNYIQNNRRNGIGSSNRDTIISHNHILNNGQADSIHTGTGPATGIDFESGSCASNILVTTNEFKGNLAASVNNFNGNFIDIENNFMDSQIYVQAASNSKVIGNTIASPQNATGGGIYKSFGDNLYYTAGTYLGIGVEYTIKKQWQAPFGTGIHAFGGGVTYYGATSGAQIVGLSTVISSGSWATSNAVGTFNYMVISGAIQSGENICSGVGGTGTCCFATTSTGSVQTGTLDYTTIGAADSNDGTVFIATNYGPIGANDAVFRMQRNVAIKANTIIGFNTGIVTTYGPNSKSAWDIDGNTLDNQGQAGILSSQNYANINNNSLIRQSICIELTNGTNVTGNNNTCRLFTSRALYFAGTTTSAQFTNTKLYDFQPAANTLSAVDISQGKVDLIDTYMSLGTSTTGYTARAAVSVASTATSGGTIIGTKVVDSTFNTAVFVLAQKTYLKYNDSIRVTAPHDIYFGAGATGSIASGTGITEGTFATDAIYSLVPVRITTSEMTLVNTPKGISLTVGATGSYLSKNIIDLNATTPIGIYEAGSGASFFNYFNEISNTGAFTGIDTHTATGGSQNAYNIVTGGTNNLNASDTNTGNLP